MYGRYNELIWYSSQLLLFICITIAIVALARGLVHEPIRWRHISLIKWREEQIPRLWLTLLFIDRSSRLFMEKEFVLRGCGWHADAAWYFAVKRISTLIIIMLFTLGISLQLEVLRWNPPISPLLVIVLALSLLIFLWNDRSWLGSIRKVRTLQITKEIYAVSNQLLYLSESRLHIHTKLTKCISFTKTIRPEIELLLADWYHHPGKALQRFKDRLGTDEGMSFTETIDALRLHESSLYYDLLRQRISDYKEKLELAKESRKESASYILFVIAGVPILYTFQVFIFPWVKEGQRLFDMLQ